MAIEREEFKFPDEVAAEPPKADKDSDFEIELVDDTPLEDRLNSAPMPKEIVDEIEKDDLSEYSDTVKQRLLQMKKVWHDERRAKEAAAREREEALRFAQAQQQEVKRLKERLGVGERAFVNEVSKAATNDLTTAKEKLKLAYESGDSEQIANAQEMLTDAKLKLREVERFRPSLQEEESNVEQTQQAQAPQRPAPNIDPKAEAWRQKNAWFGVDEEMTALALGLHEKLVRSGFDPRSDEYYARVDQTMRKRFPENFGDAEQPSEKAQTPPRAKAANVVAPVTRSTAPRQTVRLTPAQVGVAKKLGISNEQYARELMKLENDNG